MNQTRQLTIFCGGPLEHDSERFFLRALVDHLARGATAAVVLCNFQLKSRQIDFVVATEDAVALVEAKATKLPVRGEINGPWERLSPSGEWTPFRNPYQQALDAKNRLRDAMAQAAPIGDFYPDGFVAITADLAAGSTITSGDFKVRIGSTAEVLAALGATGGSPWSLATWQSFARSLKLTATALDAALGAEGSRVFSEWAVRYRRAFTAEYRPDADLWIPEDDEQAEALIASIHEQAGSFLWGPSGCGKSLMAKWLGLRLTAAGAICLFVSAKLFSGSWAEAIQREISLLVDSYDPRFLRRATQLGMPVVLIFDGLNELSADNVRQALRGLKALARRYDARVVVTSQEPRPEGLAGLGSVSVRKPSEILKARIAERGHGALTSAAKEVLRGVRSGFEARIVGDIGNELRSNVTRLELVDQLIRTRLGPHARSGSLGLRRLARGSPTTWPIPCRRLPLMSSCWHST
ncbi:MAG: NERD domain-containing protein [Mesorhizobium sp.]